MAPRTGPMDERELAAIVNRQIAQTTLYESDATTGLGVRRAKALRYFEGDEDLGGDVPVQAGRARIVSRDVADTHGWILPALLRVFHSGERVVVYQPRREGAEEGAEQATDYINYVFYSECNGYRVSHSTLWDSLLFGNGIFKHWWDDTPDVKIETLSGITELKYLDLLGDPDVKITKHKAYDDTNDNAMADGGGMDGDLEGETGAPAPIGGAPVAGGAGAMPAAGPVNGFGAPGAAPPPVGLPNGAGGNGLASAGMAAPEVAGMAPGAGESGTGGMGPAVPGETFAFPQPQLHDLTIERTLSRGRVRLAAIPHEEFRIDRNAIFLDEEHVRFCAHVCKRTRSDLVSDGYPRDIVDELPATTNITPQARARQNLWSGDNAPDRSTELIEIWECYLQVDFNGDGEAEWRRVVTGQGASEHQILLNEEWGDGLPFTDITPSPIPHRWTGDSLYDELSDIQRTKTVFLRGVVDNIRWVNNPMLTAPENGVAPTSMDRLYNPEHGAVILTRGDAQITPLAIPFIADKVSFGLDMMDKVREFRTGVSATTMALDPEALVNQTATAVNAAATASYSKTESYARNIAEGFKRLFSALLKIICQHQDQKRTIRLRGEWVTMDPRGWDSDMDVTVNVGLGSGSRDRDMSVLGVIIQKMEQVVQTLGMPAAVALDMGPDRIFDAYRKFIESGGINSPESFFPDVSKDKVQALLQLMQSQQTQADPHAAESQARVQLIGAQMEQVKAQTAALGLKAQGDMAGQQTDAQKAAVEQQHQLAQIENLRAAAMANLAKAGATQSDAATNAELAKLEALDTLKRWNTQTVDHAHEQQRIISEHAIDAGKLVSDHVLGQQKLENDHSAAMQRMKQRVSTPGVDT